MQRFRVALMSCLVAGLAGTSWAQSNITLVADADTSIREHSPDVPRGGDALEVRSRPNEGSGRQHVAYIRFDLSVLANAPETNAVFSVARGTQNSQTFTNGEVHVYGLLDTAGNTPQQWTEGLTYNTSGSEVPGDGNAETQDLDESRLQFIGDLPDSLDPASGETLSISNATLDAFIADRFANGGFVTLMLVEEDGIEKELYFENREVGTSPPSLAVVGQLGGGGMDTNPPTIALVSPTNGAVNVDVGTDVTALFSEPMDAATISSNTFILYDATSNSVPATVSYNEGTLTATLNPNSLLASTSTYTVVVEGGPSGVTDLATNALEADFAWSFTTGEAPEVEPDAPISLAPEADTYLTNDTKDGPTSTHGGKEQFEVRWHEAPRVRIGYLRYDISAVPASLFDTATLEGSFTDSSRNGPGSWDVYGVDDSEAGNNWDEGTVNYATAAGLDPSAPVGSFSFTNSTFLGTIILDGDDTEPITFASNTDDLDLTAFLEADTDGKVTFILASSGTPEGGPDGPEYRIDAKELNSTDWHGPVTLNFIPPLTITDLLLTDEPSVVLSWNGFSTHSYGVEHNSDVQMQSNWVAVASNLVMNTYTDAAPTAVQGYYRVVDEGERPPMEFFFDDFESGVGDWQASAASAGTDWELGAPTFGPGAASSGTNAWGTNLEDNYGPNADVSLLSPVIDLSSATTATLTFTNYLDTDGFADFAHIYVRDASGAEIPALPSPILTYDGSTIYLFWTPASIELPAEALGQIIRLEFQFVSDAFSEWTGWYIDDVRVAE